MLKLDITKEMTFEAGKELLFSQLGEFKIMALASSVNDYVMVRNMSVIFYNEMLQFKTDMNFRKTKQLVENSNVALCWNGIQIEGVATINGLVVDEPDLVFATKYKELLWGSYNKYSHEDTEVLVSVAPKFVEMWDSNEAGDAFQIFLDFQTKTARIIPYD